VKPYNDFNVIQPVAYPFAANTMILVYNRTVLSDARVAGAYQRMFGRSFSPALDWGEFVRAVNLVRSANPEFYGVALQGAAGGWLYYEWVNFLFGLGGRVMNKRYGWQSDLSTPLEIDSPEASRAAELYLSLRSANAGDFFATDAVKQRDIMLEGKTAFALMWTDYIPDLAARGDMFGFAPVPGTKSMIAGGCYFINKKTRSPERAAKLVSYLLSPAVQKFLALHGLFPPTRAALADVQVQAKPYMPAVRESLERGVYMAEAGPDADLISEQITNSMQRAWRGEIAPTDVGSSASRAIQDGRKQIK
jgi:ABC-type glycerol-3-phosphate transport system substrate-binding protein